MTLPLDSDRNLNLFRLLALGVTSASALGSEALTLQVGRNNDSVILVLLFSVWVLSPFLVLFTASLVSLTWNAQARKALYFLMIAVSLLSLVFYGRWLSFQISKKAFVFLIIPAISWIAILTLYLIFRRANASRKSG